MKLNNRGFAISSIMYIILVLTLILITAILGLLSSRKLILDKVKRNALSEINDNISNIRYKIGDLITLLDEQYYVIGVDTDYVTALKAEPLTVDEVNDYGGVGTEDNYINKFPINGNLNTSNNINGYGGMAYYTSETCGYVNNQVVSSGCTTVYNNSDIKHVVDAWKDDKFKNDELTEVGGYSARLIELSELEEMGYVRGSTFYPVNDNVPGFLYNSDYNYWTMTSRINSSEYMWWVDKDGNIGPTTVDYGVYHSFMVVRPVININKYALD